MAYGFNNDKSRVPVFPLIQDSPLPIEYGGTGQTIASDARAAILENNPLSISEGGTGSTTAKDALDAILYGSPISINNNDVEINGDLDTRGDLLISSATPTLNFKSTGINPYSSFIKAYDTNSPGNGHNLVMQSGGVTFIGGGESASSLYSTGYNNTTLDGLTVNGGGESLILSSDTTLRLYSNCNTVANRYAMTLTDNGQVKVNDINRNITPNVMLYDGLGDVTTDQYNGLSSSHSLGLALRGASDNNFGNFATQLCGSDQNDANLKGAVDSYVMASNLKTDNTRVNNFFRVWVRKDGSCHYSVTSPANFREDLGINNASNLNAGTLGVAYGGTGQSSPTVVTTLSSIMSAKSGITVTGADLIYWGKVVALRFTWKSSTAISVPATGNITNIAIATLNSAYRPSKNVYGHSNGDGAGAAYCCLETDGSISVGAFEGTGAARTIPANTECSMYLCYLRS